MEFTEAIRKKSMTDNKGITLMGLGPGDHKLLTREAWDLLQSVSEIYLRTRLHPTVEGFPKGLTIYSFDDYYENEDDIEIVYDRIIKKVIDLGRRPEGVIYAVPGHPYVAEVTCTEITRIARNEGIRVQVIEGLSFVESTLSILGEDMLPQTSVVDALELVLSHYPKFPPSIPALIAQIHSRAIAAELKITLMAVYPDTHQVHLVHRAGTEEGCIETLPLYKIDQGNQIGMLTSLYVPSLSPASSFEDFQELVAHLRSADGCPWDREQDHQTLRRTLIEEVYEVLGAIDTNDSEAMCEEFGDLLLQIVLQTQIAAEFGEFTMPDVIRGIHKKLVYRHPHVFGDVIINGPSDQG
jgi:tetrapyrrole methylase family protein/MazG family protein